MLYLVVKWIHILAAITALGSNITYAVWFSRRAPSSQVTLFVLNTVGFLDRRVANPAYGLSLLSGIGMVLLGHWSLVTPWLLTGIILYVCTALLGVFAFSPIMRRQIQLAESAGPQSPEYLAAARRSMLIGLLLILIVVVIVFLTVTKPALW
jgi:uncharacterized membrane protein